MQKSYLTYKSKRGIETMRFDEDYFDGTPEVLFITQKQIKTPYGERINIYLKDSNNYIELSIKKDQTNWSRHEITLEGEKSETFSFKIDPMTENFYEPEEKTLVFDEKPKSGYANGLGGRIPSVRTNIFWCNDTELGVTQGLKALHPFETYEILPEDAKKELEKNKKFMDLVEYYKNLEESVEER